MPSLLNLRRSPRPLPPARLLLLLLPLALLSALLSGCDTVVMNAPGDVAAQQGHLIWVSTVLMLLIIVPVIALTVIFAWHYRASNSEAKFRPDWDHSTQLELVIWAAPLLIIIALGAVTWISTHTLDPYRSLRRLDATHPVSANVKPITVDVVALDWKWLFIYPDQGIATVNELAAPAGVPITFNITASSVMNSFFVPALAGQIYAMPGMRTQLHAVMAQSGDFEGFSANYSGAGFSGMHFRFKSLSQADFDQWVQAAKSGGQGLDRSGYMQLVKPSERDPVKRFSNVDAGLFDAILNRCADGKTMCMSQMSSIDAHRGQAAVCTAANPDGKLVTLADQPKSRD